MKQAAISTILIICLLSNTGCWDYRDLESQNIPFVAAFDSADGKPEQFIASALSPNLDPETKGQVQLISLQTPLAGSIEATMPITPQNCIAPDLFKPIFWERVLPAPAVIQMWSIRQNAVPSFQAQSNLQWLKEKLLSY